MNNWTKCGDTGPGVGPEFCFHLGSNLKSAVSTLQTRLGHGQFQLPETGSFAELMSDLR